MKKPGKRSCVFVGCRGGPPCPPDIYIRPHDVGQAQRPVPTNLREKSLASGLSLDLKSNPPTPPCQGGKKNQKPLYRRRASPFHTPLTRGGRGGCLYHLTKGVGGRTQPGRERSLSSQRFFQQPEKSRRGAPPAFLCFYCCDCCACAAIRFFRNCTAWMTSCQTRRPSGPEL